MATFELSIGSPAPDFSLPATGGKILSLADFREKKLLIYFYPKDDTPGCTQQACALSSHLLQLNNLSLAVVGVSKDSMASHEKFAKRFDLKFPLLSDKDSDVCERYGVWKEKSMMGKTYMGIERSSFILDENGKMIALWRGVKPSEHLDWVMKEIK